MRPNLNEVELVPAHAVGGQSVCLGCVFYYPAHPSGDYPGLCLTHDMSCIVESNKALIWKEKVNAEASA